MSFVYKYHNLRYHTPLQKHGILRTHNAQSTKYLTVPLFSLAAENSEPSPVDEEEEDKKEIKRETKKEGEKETQKETKKETKKKAKIESKKEEKKESKKEAKKEAKKVSKKENKKESKKGAKKKTKKKSKVEHETKKGKCNNTFNQRWMLFISPFLIQWLET